MAGMSVIMTSVVKYKNFSLSLSLSLNIALLLDLALEIVEKGYNSIPVVYIESYCLMAILLEHQIFLLCEHLHISANRGSRRHWHMKLSKLGMLFG